MLHCEPTGFTETQQATVCFTARSQKGQNFLILNQGTRGQTYQLAVERNEGGRMEKMGRPQTDSPPAKESRRGNWDVLTPLFSTLLVAGIWPHVDFTDPQPRLGERANTRQEKTWQMLIGRSSKQNLVEHLNQSQLEKCKNPIISLP